MGIVQESWQTVRDPANAFRATATRSLEDVLGWFLKHLVLTAILAGVSTFVVGILQATYLAVLHNVVIDYWRLSNYLAQVAVGTFFFALFMGTFGLFFVTLIAHRFARSGKYTRVVAVTCIACAPLLLFGWLYSPLFVALLLWAVVLLLEGMRQVRADAAAVAARPQPLRKASPSGARASPSRRR